MQHDALLRPAAAAGSGDPLIIGSMQCRDAVKTSGHCGSVPPRGSAVALCAVVLALIACVFKCRARCHWLLDRLGFFWANFESHLLPGGAAQARARLHGGIREESAVAAAKSSLVASCVNGHALVVPVLEEKNMAALR